MVTKNLKIQEVKVSPDSVRAAITALETAIRKHTQMKQLLDELLSVQDGANRARPTGARGRRRGSKTLRQVILEVLKASKRPLRPVELRDRVLDAGYQTTAKPISFYTAVFNAARQDPEVAKTVGGFQLKAHARRKGSKKGKKRGKRGKKTRAA